MVPLPSAKNPVEQKQKLSKMFIKHPIKNQEQEKSIRIRYGIENW
jgi:hypothetical protein